MALPLVELFVPTPLAQIVIQYGRIEPPDDLADRLCILDERVLSLICIIDMTIPSCFIQYKSAIFESILKKDFQTVVHHLINLRNVHDEHELLRFRKDLGDWIGHLETMEQRFSGSFRGRIDFSFGDKFSQFLHVLSSEFKGEILLEGAQEKVATYDLCGARALLHAWLMQNEGNIRILRICSSINPDITTLEYNPDMESVTRRKLQELKASRESNVSKKRKVRE